MVQIVPRGRHRVLLGLAIAIGVVVALVVVALLWQTISYYVQIKSGAFGDLETRRREASISALVANARVTDADLERLVPAGIVAERGSRKARVTVVEFVDYQCPFCQRSAPAVRKVIDAFGDRVHFVVRAFPLTSLHPTAMQSAVAAQCVLLQGQEPYWRFHDLLLANIESQTSENLRTWAQASGAQVDAFARCLDDERVLADVEEDLADGLSVGVQGTPTFFVNGIRIQGALDEALLSSVINAAFERMP